MLRQNWGSVVCPGCKNLVGVRDERCLTCGRWNPGLWGFGPTLSKLGRDLGFTPFVITVCCAFYAVTLLFDTKQIGTGGIFTFLSPSVESRFLFGASGALPIFGYGRWWTVFTAGWLHGGALHIVFNLMALRSLAPVVADFYGASRMAIIYMLSSIVGFTVTSVIGAFGPAIPFLSGARGITVGASAGITGLLGAILLYSRRTGSRDASSHAMSWIYGLILMGLSSQVVDNWGHIGGLAGGYAIAKLLDPLHPERLDHLLIALGLLVVTVIAFVASIVYGLPLI